MTATAISTKPFSPLPRKFDDWVRKISLDRTINDLVEELHVRLLGNDKTKEKYVSLLEAVYDEQAVEGSLSADNVMAAMMIRDAAMGVGGHALQREKLATISKALTVVLRRYGVSRKERRRMLDGEVVPANGEDASE